MPQLLSVCCSDIDGKETKRSQQRWEAVAGSPPSRAVFTYRLVAARTRPPGPLSPQHFSAGWWSRRGGIWPGWSRSPLWCSRPHPAGHFCKATQSLRWTFSPQDRLLSLYFPSTRLTGSKTNTRFPWLEPQRSVTGYGWHVVGLACSPCLSHTATQWRLPHRLWPVSDCSSNLLPSLFWKHHKTKQNLNLMLFAPQHCFFGDHPDPRNFKPFLPLPSYLCHLPFGHFRAFNVFVGRGTRVRTKDIAYFVSCCLLFKKKKKLAC